MNFPCLRICQKILRQWWILMELEWMVYTIRVMDHLEISCIIYLRISIMVKVVSSSRLYLSKYYKPTIFSNRFRSTRLHKLSYKVTVTTNNKALAKTTQIIRMFCYSVWFPRLWVPTLVITTGRTPQMHKPSWIRVCVWRRPSVEVTRFIHLQQMQVVQN